jgi:hypothetical protein
VTPAPTAGKKIVDFEEKLDEQIAGGPPEQPKRGRGRPPKEPQPEQQEPMIDNEIIKKAVCVPFDLWARSQRLKDLRLTDDEAQALSEPVKTLLDYYLPEVPAIAFAWASLAITAYAITSPRLFKIEEEREIRKRKNEALRNADQARKETRSGPGTRTSHDQQESNRFPRSDEITPLKIQN